MGLNKYTDADAVEEALTELIDSCSLTEVLENLHDICLQRLDVCDCYKAAARHLSKALVQIKEWDNLRDAVQTVAQRLEGGQ